MLCRSTNLVTSSGKEDFVNGTQRAFKKFSIEIFCTLPSIEIELEFQLNSGIDSNFCKSKLAVFLKPGVILKTGLLSVCLVEPGSVVL